MLGTEISSQEHKLVLLNDKLHLLLQQINYSLSPTKCVCACVCTCIPMCLEAGSKHGMHFLMAFCFFFFEIRSLIEFGSNQLCWIDWPASLRHPPDSALPYRCTELCLEFYVSARVLISGLHNFHSKHFINGAIIPVLTNDYYKSECCGLLLWEMRF